MNSGIDWSAIGVLAHPPPRLRELAKSFPAVEGDLLDLARLDPQTQSGRRFQIAGRISAKMQGGKEE